jgi:hypothetical protein
LGDDGDPSRDLFGRSPVIGRWSSVTSPARSASAAYSSRSSVVLPLPFGPIRPTTSPGAAASATLSSTGAPL